MKFLLLRASGWDHFSEEGDKDDLEKIRSAPFFIPSVYPPLGLEYIGATLEQEGHKVELIDLSKEKPSKVKFKNALNTNDAVGITVNTDEIKVVSNLARVIKEIDADIPLFIGGPHCTFYPIRSLKDVPNADITVRGEGEYVILDLASYLKGEKKLSEIPGVYYRKSNQIKNGKPLEIIKDLDSLPFPARHLVDKYDYGKVFNRPIFKLKFTSLHINRGCPAKCRFCARYGNIINNWGFRRRSVENVVEEIQEIDKKYRSAVIVDDIFMADKKQAHKIMDSLIEIGTKIELMIAGARVDSADPDLYRKMKKANVKLITYGIESGNQDVLDFYRKGITIEQIKKAVNLSRKIGFITIGSFMIGAPMETRQHLENTINFAKSLPLDIAIFAPLFYYEGSQIWKEAVKEKKILPDEFMVAADSRRDLGQFTPDELFAYCNEMSKQFFNRPKYILGQIYRSLLRGDINWLIIGTKALK
jgi:radical SAM superfamily enzyme YgiQ (UPF0313 family)